MLLPVHASLASAVLILKSRATLVIVSMDHGTGNMATIIDYCSKSGIRVVTRFLHARGNSPTKSQSEIDKTPLRKSTSES